jgi:hypothetical protein
MINVDHNPVETEEGVWTEYEGSRVRIAHISCMEFQRKLSRLQQPYVKQIEKKSLDPKVQKKIMCEAMAGTIFRDADFVNSSGEPVPFTAELAAKVLANQFGLREFITEYASNLDNYRQEEAKALGEG